MGETTTPEQAIKRGDHNVISIHIAELVSKTKIPKLVAPYFAEFFGTMMLTLVITLSAGQGAALAPLAIGSILMCMIFAYGHLSGGHYNPAVSLAVMVRGKIDVLTLLVYVVSQVVGGLCGAALGGHVLPDGTSTPVPGFERTGPAFLVEFIFTYALATTVLNVATTVSVGENSFYGLAIGFVVMSGAVSTGSVSGAVFNPAVGTGLLVVAGNASQLWLYWVACLLGGLGAGIMFHVVNSGENDITFGKTTEIKVPRASVGPQVSSYRMSLSDGAASKDVNGRPSLAPSFRLPEGKSISDLKAVPEESA